MADTTPEIPGSNHEETGKPSPNDKSRSDTFTIRGYGEARDSSGQPIATVVCEAVVQRLPDWVDPADKAGTALVSLTSLTNKTLGRGFRLISFRWLNDDEI